MAFIIAQIYYKYKMARHDIVVIGASAGGVTALTEFVKHLPKDFGGSIFIVLHISPYSPSYLPSILTQAGFLEATHPKDGEKIKKSHIYVAPVDHHMLLEDTSILVKKGPKENRFRPSVDALFRSAAYVFGPRVIGIILTGLLNDGTSGLWSIKRLGGVTIVQDPDDADYPSMPTNALEYVEADHVLPVTQMGQLVSNLTKQRKKSPKPKITKRERELLKMEVVIARQDNAFEMGILDMGVLTPFTCPECHGVLVKLVEGKTIRFRCHTGHAFTASALLSEVTKKIEDSLWQAMRGLEETSMLLNEIGNHFTKQGQRDVASMFTKKGEVTAQKAKVIHDYVFTQEQLSEDIRYESTRLNPKGKTKRIKK
jgi:two-component system, chemotaxis family, protein-glutamate methylesterase/glutaminase